MAKVQKSSSKRPKSSPNIQKLIDDNKAKTQALKKLLKFIEGDESYLKVAPKNPKNK